MPTTIPFDPALVLGNLLPPGAIDTLKGIGGLQSKVDAAEARLNTMISLKRSLQMTLQEMSEMGISQDELKDLSTQLQTVDAAMTGAAKNYAAAVVANAQGIEAYQGVQDQIASAPESPIDYNRTQVKRMPLSADTLKMNVQYFSFDRDSQTAESFISQIGGFVSDSLSIFDDTISSQASAEAKNQTASQVENHDVVGTLVVSIACTHKDVAVLAPFYLDPDKAVGVWNQLYPDDKMLVDELGTFATPPKDPNASVDLLSGCGYGSSFVGMVHLLRSESTQSSQSMTSVAASLQEQYSVAACIVDMSGGFGIDSSFSADFKNLLSSQNITSHVSLMVMGIIPSIKSSEVQIAVKTFSQFDPNEMMGKLATLANATESDHKSVAEAAESARTGGKMVALEQAKIESVMSSLGKIDDGKNQILDINSMMTALQDYVDQARAGSAGVPITFYVKKLSKQNIAEAWTAKYFPSKYIDPTDDDSAPSGGTPTPTPAPQPTPDPQPAPDPGPTPSS